LKKNYFYHKILQIDEIYTTISYIQCLGREAGDFAHFIERIASRHFLLMFIQDKTFEFTYPQVQEDFKSVVPLSIVCPKVNLFGFPNKLYTFTLTLNVYT